MCTKGNLHIILKEVLFTNLFRVLLPRRIHAVKLPFILLHLISCVEHNVKCSHGVTAGTTLNSKQFLATTRKSQSHRVNTLISIARTLPKAFSVLIPQ